MRAAENVVPRGSETHHPGGTKYAFLGPSVDLAMATKVGAFVPFALLILRAVGHPEYLKDCPALTDSYFSQWGVGAVGHTGGISGARLNPFGEAFKHGRAGECAVLDEDDDDDDDDHHGGWGTKLCCADSDGDGLTNGAELGGECNS